MANSQATSIPGEGSPRVSLDKSKSPHKEFSGNSDKVGETIAVTSNPQGMHRQLSNRKVQLVAVGSSIGTALFMSIGGALNSGGPGSLLVAFLIYNCILALINNCMAEMTVYMPVSGSFIRLAGHWVDDALGFCVGWNFFLFACVIIPFEITALSLVLSYWSDNIPVAAICGGTIALYFIINVFAVAVYGEVEFWLSSGKIILLIMLFCFTFVTMVGGNPAHDAYGFRHWKNPGAFAEYVHTGNLGRFEGFLAAIWFASFSCVGPEFVSIMSAEAKHPRTYVKTAFKVVYFRIVLFFMGGALAVGILVAYNNPTLDAIYKTDTGHSGSAAASPYIISMTNLGVSIFPHIITALISTTIFSAGNANVYYATRSLYGLALEGRAPKFLRKCTKQGIPIYCFGIAMLFPFLSFLQVSSNSKTVLTWLINLATGATVIDYIVICITYISFHRACVAQGFDRKSLPYFGYFQPWGAYIALAFEIVVVTCYGYLSCNPFDYSAFITAYFMPVLVPCLFLGWKYAKGTKWLAPKEVDLIWEAPEITAYEEALEEPPIGFFADCYNTIRGKSGKISDPEGHVGA